MPSNSFYPVINGEKECTVCHVLKPIENFAKDSRTKQGFAAKCKLCKKQYNDKWYSSPGNKQKKREYGQKHFLKKYGLTIEKREKLLCQQDYRCAICKITLDNSSPVQSPHVDHCHINGHVRGILCTRCNSGLGLFRDNPDFLLSASSYLRENS